MSYMKENKKLSPIFNHLWSFVGGYYGGDMLALLGLMMFRAIPKELLVMDFLTTTFLLGSLLVIANMMKHNSRLEVKPKSTTLGFGIGLPLNAALGILKL